MTRSSVVLGKFRITVPHNETEPWHEWAFIPGWHGEPVIVIRDSIGRRRRDGAWRRWVILMCNNTACPGRAIVPASLMEDAANAADERCTP